MNIRVNGDTRAVADGATVAEVLAELSVDRPGVAVALDGEVLPRGAWAGQKLYEDARLEVLVAVQGG
ncbi:sulfur carrier protein ThiS [Pseudonocardiaceae bacterium YIM PH 21723]|nr:sulfur carrier protein ThiS [Pseudonocardiaceae bacterium YIM PH 21723]